MADDFKDVELDVWRKLRPDATFAMAAAMDRVQKAEITRLRGLFRTMRRRWFEVQLMSRPPEREWEDAADEWHRAHQNERLYARYTRQTEAILDGDRYNLTPMCAADLERAEP